VVSRRRLLVIKINGAVIFTILKDATSFIYVFYFLVFYFSLLSTWIHRRHGEAIFSNKQTNKQSNKGETKQMTSLQQKTFSVRGLKFKGIGGGRAVSMGLVNLNWLGVNYKLDTVLCSFYTAIHYCNMISLEDGLEPSYLVKEVLTGASEMIVGVGGPENLEEAIGFYNIRINHLANGYRIAKETEASASKEIQMWEDPIPTFSHYWDENGIKSIINETDGSEIPYAWDKVKNSGDKKLRASKALDKFAFAVTRGIAK